LGLTFAYSPKPKGASLSKCPSRNDTQAQEENRAMPRVTKQAIIEAQAQEIEALKLELEQSRKDYLQEQAYIKALAKLDFERKDLQAELAKQAQEIEALKQELAQAKQSAIKVTNWYNDKILESQAETSFVQEALEALKQELAQAEQALQAEQEKHKQALAREKGLRADIEGTSLQLEQVQAELAQAYGQGEKEYQAIRLELIQARNKYTQAQAELEQVKQELAYYKLEQAWNAGVGFLGSTITKLYKLRQKYNPVTPEKQGQGKALEQELALVLDSIE